MSGQSSNAASRTAKAAKRDAMQYGPVHSNGTSQQLAWDQVNSDLLANVVGAVAHAGDAISFAAGRQGDWLSMTLLTEAGRTTIRSHSIAEAEDNLERVRQVARERDS